MAKKTIAVDIDGVLAANAPSPFNGIYDSEEVAKLKCIHDSRRILDKLKDSYDLVVVTSRLEEPEIVSRTTDWLTDYYQGVFKDIYYTASVINELEVDDVHLSKAELCKNIKASYLIDDQVRHCFPAAESGIPSLLFGDYLWNKADVLPEGVVRVSDWQAVEDYFNGQS